MLAFYWWKQNKSSSLIGEFSLTPPPVAAAAGALQQPSAWGVSNSVYSESELCSSYNFDLCNMPFKFVSKPLSA